MAKIQTGLGKGLGALITDINSIQSSAAANREIVASSSHPLLSTVELELDKIEPNPYQPRTEFKEEALQELSDSIKLIGLIQPITVRPVENNRYQIISGERRYRASLMAGKKTIPAYIRKTDDRGMLEMAIVENIQREDLDSIEIALSFQRLIEECNLTQDAMAERVGKKRATVTNYLRLLKLPAEIQLALRSKRLTMGHAKALLSVSSPTKQLRLANQIIEKDLSVRQIEQKVQNLQNKSTKKESEDKEIIELPDTHFRVIELIGKYFNNNVTAKRNAKGEGEITIRFKNDSEIEEFLKSLEKTN